MNNQSSEADNKEKKYEKSPENKQIHGTCDLNKRELNLAVLKKLNEIQKGSLMSSENKYMNKTSTLPNKLKV